MEPVPVDGSEQWVLLRGIDATAPVLLVLHDGPGLAQIAFARANQRELERAFVVANWDQRGAGLSYRPGIAAESMTLPRLVDDTIAVSRWLCERFHRDRLVLLGHGWGSVLGLHAVARAPELYSAYIGADQVVEPAEAERRLYRWVVSEATQRGSKVAVKDLRGIGAPPYRSALSARLVGRWAGRFGGVRYGSRPMGTSFRHLLELREYTLMDIVRWHRGLAFSQASLGAAVAGLDLASTVTHVDVPAYFVGGRHDRVCDPELAREYLRVLDAPRKGWAWIEEAAHEMPSEQPDALAAAVAHFAFEAGGPPVPTWALAS
jgi:pimeloyl-ACP methyl ester carboxylesterase